MKIHDCEQGSPEWFALHVGKATAGGFDQLISPKKFEVKRGEGPKSYVARKLAEWFRGEPDGDTFSSFATENGLIREPNAIGAFELETGMEVQRVGFIETDNGAYGCSPDGLITFDKSPAFPGAQCGLEIKCPSPAVHVKYLIQGDIPPEYRPQVYGSLYVTGFPKWWFMSYAVGFPPLIIAVEMDEQKEAAIKEALELFSLDFEAGKRFLIDKNGGEPKRKTEKLSGERPRFTWEMDRNDVPVP